MFAPYSSWHGLRVDPTFYAPDEVAVSVAVVIDEETEAERAADRKLEPPRPKPARRPKNQGLLGLLAQDDGVYRPADSLHAFQYLERLPVLHRCAVRLNLSDAEFAFLVVEKLAPPNWSAFFWMGSYFDANKSHDETIRLAILRHEAADKAAIARYIRARSSDAGKASGQTRATRAKVTAEQVAIGWAELEKTKPKHSIAAMLAKQYGVDASHIRKLKKK